ncbi:MAG: glycoside hydrolase family 2 TIM barrel-domain containing protein [Ilumatobacteraceae bacterium]
MLPDIGALRPWEDPAVTSLRRLPMHATIRRDDVISLDGEWRLAVHPHPDAVPESAIVGEPAGVPVQVPGNWTLQGIDGERPHYTNVQMPFPGPPPRLPERQPTGVYRRAFGLAPRPRGTRTIVQVGAAESVHAVWVNGDFVGYGTDSRLSSEYDATDAVRDGTNEIAIVVWRWSAHSYLEDQDQWWMAGLHRSVTIERRPPVHVADVHCDTDLDPRTGTGRVRVATRVACSHESAPGWTVRTRLIAPGGARVGRDAEGAVPHLRDAGGAGPHLHDASYVYAGHVVEAEWRVPRAAAWSAEAPRLHEGRGELVAPDGAVVDAVTQRCGIRRVEVRDRALLVNGRRVWIFGVNRHEHHPDRGKALTLSDVRRDLEEMRRHNVTAIRTSHYPHHPDLYDLCDELGMYVVDEANAECHAYNAVLADDERWRAAFVERGTRMVARDRNHPCVIMWSLGNESGYGASHDAMAAAMRRVDPSRPLHYEGAVDPRSWRGGGETRATVPGAEIQATWESRGRGVTDVVCPMYPSVADIRRYGEAGRGDRPLIMCEYSHAMGNSNGGLADYWEAITETPGLQGGFIWEWKDHGLRRRMPDGSTRLAYGGDFGDAPHDGNFVADGLVSADLEPHPALREVAWVYRPVTVALETVRGVRRLRVTNRRSFTALGDLAASWELWAHGRLAAHGRLRVPDVAPGRSVRVALPADAPRGSADVHLTVRWALRSRTWWADAGHVVAWDQVTLRPPRRAEPAPRRPRRAPRRTAGAAAPAAPQPADGVLAEPVEVWLWRAATDNDGFKLLPELRRRIRVGGGALERWLEQGVDRRPAGELVRATVERTVADDGAVTYRHRIVVPARLAGLPRVGVRFALPARYATMRWYGRGPHENYPDRRGGAMLGVWSGPPDAMPYLVPQEYGLRTDVRWWECRDEAAGEVVRIEALDPVSLHVSATRHRTEDLHAAANAADLRPSPRIWVHLDAAHRGLGTASCGPDVAPRHEVAAGVHEFAWRRSVVRT